VLKDFFALLYPNNCLTCNKTLVGNENLICTDCRYDLPKANFQSFKENELAQKFYGKVDIENAFAFLKFIKKGKTQRLLHQLKYNGYNELGEMVGLWMGNEINKTGFSNSFDLVVPVPLHSSKFKIRGYNQSDGFAEGLSKAFETSWQADVLIRQNQTISQTTKGRIERLENMKNAFQVSENAQIEGKHILLVDDVVTTGATLEACILALNTDGAKQVSIATIAFAE